MVFPHCECACVVSNMTCTQIHGDKPITLILITKCNTDLLSTVQYHVTFIIILKNLNVKLLIEELHIHLLTDHSSIQQSLFFNLI